jgi:hypothetical protein
VRVGDGPIAGSGAAILEQTYQVDSTVSELSIQYALVLENPELKCAENPWFRIDVLDQNKLPIPGGQLFIAAKDTLIGFKGVYFPPDGDSAYCKPWAIMEVPLSNYIGQCITARFVTSEDIIQSYFGYAYVSAFCSICNELKLTTSTNGYCGGKSTFTINAPLGASSYSWSTTNGCISGPTTYSSVTASCAGTYNVALKFPGVTICKDTLSVTVNDVPYGVPKACFTALTPCISSPVQFDASCTIPFAGTKFYWDFNNTGTYNDTSGPTPSWTYYTAGKKDVRLHIKTIEGCEADTIIQFSLDTAYVVYPDSYTIKSGPCNFCADTIVFNFPSSSYYSFKITNSFNSCYLFYETNVGTTYSGGNCNTFYRVGATNNYYGLQITTSNWCAGTYKFYFEPRKGPLPPSSCYPNGLIKDTITVKVYSKSLNAPVLTLSNDTIYSTHAASYQWYYNNTVISGATDSFFVAKQKGTYTVFAFDSSGCGAFGNNVLYIQVPVINDTEGIVLYPNPARDKLNIKGLPSENSELVIYNLLGKKIYSEVMKNKTETEIDVSSFPKGLYFIEIKSSNRILHKNVIKD